MKENEVYLISSEEIRKRVKDLGREISRDYRTRTPVFITLLKGAFVFLADLIRELTIPHEIDFITLSSYRNGSERSGLVEINNLIRKDMRGRDIILVDEIVDTGRTLSKLIDTIDLEEANSIKICTLLNKESGREINVPIDYIGFTIPDVFVIGYGLDFNEHFRHLTFITELTPDLEKISSTPERFSSVEKEIGKKRKII